MFPAALLLKFGTLFFLLKVPESVLDSRDARHLGTFTCNRMILESKYEVPVESKTT